MIAAAAPSEIPRGIPPRRQWPRGLMNDLHKATRDGSAERTAALLARGTIDINLGDPRGWTPLMCAAAIGHERIVDMLLRKRANPSIASDYEFTALHMSAQEGHLAVTQMLAKVCAPRDLEAVTYEGFTPLHVAVQVREPAVVRALIEAGANFDTRTPTGETPLYTGAMRGFLDVIKVLLDAKANPLLSRTDPSGYTYVPLDVASQSGHPDVVQELIQRFGIEGCGGETQGVDALTYAAQEQHTDVLAILAEAGVMDTGAALQAAVRTGSELSVKFLLRQHRKRFASQVSYVNTTDEFGSTPFFRGIAACRSQSCRIMRLLADAGADTTSVVSIKNAWGMVVFNNTPLHLATDSLHHKAIDGRHTTKEELHRLEAMRRLLLQVEAIHAVSWRWRSDVASISRAALAEGASRTKKKTGWITGTKLRTTLHVLRRRASKPRVLFPTLFRYSGKA